MVTYIFLLYVQFYVGTAVWFQFFPNIHRVIWIVRKNHAHILTSTNTVYNSVELFSAHTPGSHNTPPQWMQIQGIILYLHTEESQLLSESIRWRYCLHTLRSHNSPVYAIPWSYCLHTLRSHNSPVYATPWNFILIFDSIIIHLCGPMAEGSS